MLNTSPPTPSREPLSESAAPCPHAELAAASTGVLPSHEARSVRRGPQHYGVEMQADADRWSRTMVALMQCSTPSTDAFDSVDSPTHRRGPALTRAGSNEVRTFTVTLLEKLANSLLALSWHDPTLCNYEEQIWAPGLAQKSGSCALSGLHISRGDRIYRPRTRGKMAPLNGNAMILASALPQTKED